MNALTPFDWLQENPAADRFTPPLSVQLLDAGRTFAERLNRDEFAGLDSDTRADLRGLALSMIAWSGEAQTLQDELADARLRESGWLPRQSRLARVFRRFRRG